MTDSSSCSPTTIQTYPEEIVCPLAKLGRLSPSCAAAFDNAYHHKLVSSVSNYHPRPTTASTLHLDYRQNCVRYCSAGGATNRYGSQSAAAQKYDRACLSAAREKAFSQNSLVSSSGCCGDSPVNFSSGKDSPCLDQGYHTLVVSGGAQPAAWTTSSAVLAAASATVVASNKLRKTYNGNNGSGCGQQFNYFDKLTDALVIKILSFLSTNELCSVSSACRRFYNLAWDQSLWETVCLRGDRICGDKAVKCVLRRLCSQQSSAGNVGIRQVYVYDGAKISDRGLTLLARRCPRLTLLHLQNCPQIGDTSIAELATKCPELQHLDLTGCSLVSCINITPTLDSPKKLYLQYLDLTDCLSVQDDNLNVILRNCPQLTYLYLRRCIKITDNGVKFIPSFCSSLRELSVSDCNEVTDFALYELAKLGSNLRYLSVAKCSRVSDAGLKVIAKRCYKLRYLNVRGCEAVSDDAIMMLARSCPRLRALDIGKCDVSDAGLRAIAESCPNLKKLSLRNCDLVTDKGVQCISYYCRGLQQLNIQDCQISIEGYRAVKRYCKRCIIEHTNPGFF